MPRRILEGVVTSDKMDKTVTVLVTRKYMHPVYKKYLRMSKKFAAHDEKNQFKVGDKVEIQECRPISKNKSWTVITQSQAAGTALRVRPASEEPAAPHRSGKKSNPKIKKEAAPEAKPAKPEKAAKPAAKKPAKTKKD